MGFKSYNELFDLIAVSIVIALFRLEMKGCLKGIMADNAMYRVCRVP
jgi:hypothetical protein